MASPLGIPEWLVSPYEFGGILLLSDAPENVKAEGIMYEDVVRGDVRLFFHHVNDLPYPVQMGVVIERIDGKALSVQVKRKGIAPPDLDYMRAGKRAQQEYLKEQSPYTVESQAGKPLWLLPEPKESFIGTNRLLTGIFDIKTEQDVRVRVVLKSANKELSRFLQEAKILDPGEPHLRGNFIGNNRLFLSGKVYEPNKDGRILITLADGILDKYARGFDKTLRVETENYGNYGIVYQLMIPTQGPGKFRCYIYPRGGDYAGWNLIRYQQKDSLIAVPSASVSFAGRTADKKQLLGEFEAGSVLSIFFSPPGASNLPIKVVLEPAP